MEKGLKVRSDSRVQIRLKSRETRNTPVELIELVAELAAPGPVAAELEGFVVAERRWRSVVRWSRISR